jgi:imidazolonepropionase
LNAAYSIDRYREVGSLELGKKADLLVLRSPQLVDLLRVGVPVITHVIKNGRVLIRDGKRL